LKAYLMLTKDSKHYKPDEVQLVADAEWAQAYPTDADAADRLSKHFANLLKARDTLRPMPYDEALARRARANIPAADIPRVIYAKVKARFPDDAPGAVAINPTGI